MGPWGFGNPMVESSGMIPVGHLSNWKSMANQCTNVVSFGGFLNWDPKINPIIGLYQWEKQWFGVSMF